MNRRRLHISLSLMVLAILAILFFQCYWVLKTFKEERQTLNIRTNILFRESIFESQAARFSMDTSGRINLTNRIDAIRVVDNIKTRMREDQDTAFKSQKTVILSFKTDGNENDSPYPDSPVKVTGYGRARSAGSMAGIDTFRHSARDGKVRRTFNLAKRGDAFFDVLQGVDMVQDSLTIPDISMRLKTSLAKEKITIPFEISRHAVDSGLRLNSANFENSNEVLVGFLKPVKFTLGLQNPSTYLFRRISSQIIVSVLLVALTVISFVVLFRNLVQQRKLTELKNDFISNITHELKTPIATVSVAVEAMKSFNVLSDPKKTDEYLSIAANELQRLSLLVDKVLKLSMFEKQEIELKSENFDLTMLIEEVVASMRLQFEKYGAIVRMNFPSDSIYLNADRLHITSVVYNLLDNALKYSKANPIINIAVKETALEVEFSVEDNGTGIAAEYKARVFDKFFRVPAGDQHNVKGYGLGLSYVAYVVERHKGIILLDSATDAGSTFTITLPRT